MAPKVAVAMAMEVEGVERVELMAAAMAEAGKEAVTMGAEVAALAMQGARATQVAGRDMRRWKRESCTWCRPKSTPHSPCLYLH